MKSTDRKSQPVKRRRTAAAKMPAPLSSRPAEPQRRPVEHALGEIIERRYSVLDGLLEGCQIIDADWRYVYVNDAAARHGRHTAKELLGHTMLEMYPGVENTHLFAVLQRCITERTRSRFENEFIYPDGTSGWFDLSIEPVPEGLFILSIDITERKRAERAAGERRKWRQLFHFARRRFNSPRRAITE